MTVELKAKHFRDTDFRHDKDCALGKALQDMGHERSGLQVGLRYVHIRCATYQVKNKQKPIVDFTDGYHLSHFNVDDVIAKAFLAEGKEEAVVRTMELVRE